MRETVLDLGSTSYYSRKFEFQGRIVITPHISGATIESQLKAARIALKLLKKYLDDFKAP